MGVSVILSDDLRDYAGMNYEVGRLLGFPISENSIHVDRSMSGKKLFQTLKHEIVEVNLMKKGLSYWESHCQALIEEQSPSVEEFQL